MSPKGTGVRFFPDSGRVKKRGGQKKGEQTAESPRRAQRGGGAAKSKCHVNTKPPTKSKPISGGELSNCNKGGGG